MKLEEKHLPPSQWAASGPQPFLLQPQFGKRSCKVSSHRRIPITGANPGARARPGPHLAPGSAVPPAQGPVLLPGPASPRQGRGLSSPAFRRLSDGLRSAQVEDVSRARSSAGAAKPGSAWLLHVDFPHPH